jgi:hypothetical protein
VIARRWPGRDRGAFTAEFAAGLPALMMLLLFGLASVQAVTEKGQCVDAARDGALVAARGGDGTAAAARVAPRGADVEIVERGDVIMARVHAQVYLLGRYAPVMAVEGTAVAAREETG